MSSMQKWGGYAFIVTGLLFVAIIVLQFAVFAPLGDAGPTTTPEVRLAAAASATNLYLIQALFDHVFAVAVVVSALAMRERLAAAPGRMRLAVISASVAAAMFLATGTLTFTALPGIVAANDLTAFRMLGYVYSGLELSAIFAFGLTALLWGWAALATRALPAALSYVILVAGLVSALAFAIPIFGLLGLFVNLIWAFWLGYLMLTQPAAAPVARARAAM